MDDLQQPGEEIKPILPISRVPSLVNSLYGLHVTSCLELNSYDDRNYHVLVTQHSSNPDISKPSTDGYVFKVLNSKDSKRPVYIEAQHALLKHITSKGIKAHRPMKNLQGNTYSLEKIYQDETVDESTPFEFYIVRLFTYLPGDPVFYKPYVPATFYEIGKFLAQMHDAFKGFHDTFYGTFNTLWSLAEIKRQEDFSHCVQDKTNSDVIKKVINAFSADVTTQYDKLSRGIIHGDVNEQNILVQERQGQESVPKEKRECYVSGMLDFSDVTDSFIIFDVAICIAYMSIECKHIDQRDVGGHILAGYLSLRNLNVVELDVLQICICARLVQSLVMGAYSFFMDPTNTYVLTTSAKGWPLLHLMWNTPKWELQNRWNKIIREYQDTKYDKSN